MDSHTNCATILRVMMDSGVQLVMVSKQLAEALGLTNANIELYPFTIWIIAKNINPILY